MNIQLTIAGKSDHKTSLVLIGSKKTKFEKSLFKPDEHIYLTKCIEKGDKIVVINQYSRVIAVIILDDKKSEGHILEACRRGGASVASVVSKNKLEKIQILSIEHDSSHEMACAEGLLLASYKFTKYVTKVEDKKTSFKEVQLVGKNIDKKEVGELKILADAMFRARDMINEPVNELNAVQLAKEMSRMSKEAGISVQVLEKKQIEALRMGGLLSVNQGSVDPPTFTIMEWKPKNAINKKPLVLVGKGVVYDSGGLSLKPTQDSMDYMKSDMSGAAAVSGAIYAVAKNNLPVHVIALVPATDNRPGFNAFAPGDIIRMYNGTTVEMLNSDAEGRMILADAIAYSKKYDPEMLINVATLTGSAAIAVGPHAMVCMGTVSKEIMDQLKESGEHVHERMIEFPLWDDYEESLKSDIADIKNVGGRYAGAITAGKFLERFTPCPFVHLDIAGVAFNKGNEGYRVKGGTGVGIRLLYNFIKQRSIKPGKRK